MMRRPAYLSQPLIQRLPNLLRDIQEGEIRIPRFQRPFVWTVEQRLLLLQSIYEGLPIGSILIWRTRENDLKSHDHLGALRLDWTLKKDQKKGEVRQYVLDGYQRLTTLYVALGRGLQREGQDDGDGAAAGEDEAAAVEPEILFDLTTSEFRPRPRHGPPPVTWLPLSILLDPFQLYQFQKKLSEAGIEPDLGNRAESLASLFKDYSIPVVPIATEDFELAKESFQRVNSGGTSMDEVHMLSALTWSPEFDLNERMGEIKVELGEVGWQHLDEKMILNTCKAALDLDIYLTDYAAIRKSIKDWPQVFLQVTESLKSAARFLKKHCQVYGPATLPYSLQVVLLADALRNYPPEAALPSTSTALTRWFWLTTYTEHFSGMSAGKLAKTLSHLRSVVSSGVTPEPPGLAREVSAPRRFDFRTARSRAIVLRMATLEPWSSSGAWDPFQVLADHGRDAVPLLLPSRGVPARAAEGFENRILVHPREANQLRRLLRDPQNCEPAVLRSHAIDEYASQALADGNLAQFLAFRREQLFQLERSFVEGLGLKYTGD